jgi:hypothetical protein
MTPTPPAPLDAARQVQAMLDRGWVWSPAEPDVLVHPADFDLAVRYDRAAGTLSISPALARHLDRVIPTPASQSKVFRR